MPKILYRDKKFNPVDLSLIRAANRILEGYAAAGYDLTLRGLYYQFVARNLFPADRKYSWDDQAKRFVPDPNGTINAEPNYDWLGRVMTDGRLAGLVDWDHIIDHTRNMEQNAHWEKPSAMIGDMGRSYLNEKWKDQPHYIEVWVEKDALKNVVGRICTQLDVPFFSCRGYTSLSEMWHASQRLIGKAKAGKTIHILHLGDHDPSGIDMSRHIKDQLEEFIGVRVHVLRIALNMVQIQRLNPPPNWAKLTDSRAKDYVAKYGPYSWELDAIPPPELAGLVSKAVRMYRDETIWKASLETEKRGRQTLKVLYKRFGEVVKFLRE